LIAGSLDKGKQPAGCIPVQTLHNVCDHVSCVLSVLFQGAFDEEKQPEGFILQGAAPKAAPDAAAEPAPASGAAAAAAPASGAAAAGAKRSREDDTAAVTNKPAAGTAAGEGDGNGEPPAKRQKQGGDAGTAGAGASAAAEVVDLMDSDEDGDAVVISD
jgi:hypothetical protein